MGVKQFFEINSVRTAVASWPNAIKDNTIDEVIICIPGNPGVTGLYVPYLESVYNITKIPTWVIAHGGLDILDTNATTGGEDIRVRGREDILNLQGQLRSKIEFIEKYTHPTTNIHLIGHSIGAWMVLEMLKSKRIKSRITTANLLFPTLERLGMTPNGRRLYTARRFNCMIKPLVWTFCKLPKCLRSRIFRWSYHSAGIDPTPMVMEISMTITSTWFVENLLFLAYDELDKVKDLDVDTLVDNKEKINIVYGRDDMWTLKEWFVSLKERIPSLYVREVQIEHGFTFYSNDEMAKVTSELIMK